MGGVSGVYAAKVVVIGAGVSGMNAAAIALACRQQVLLLDNNIDKLREADRIIKVTCRPSLPGVRDRACCARCRPDHRCGAGAGAPSTTLISNDLVSRMRPGSVLVDIAIDQGGCFEDSRPTTHAEPTFRVHDSVFTASPTCREPCPIRPPTHSPTSRSLALSLADRGGTTPFRADPPSLWD